jgi:DNA modification methylase
VKVLDLISQETKSPQKDFSFYWSKKSSAIAASIYKVFASDTDVVMDPFIGSGSSLYGLKSIPNKMKFIGVDLNQLPIELVHFNMSTLTNVLIENVTLKINDFIKTNSEVYLYHLDQGGEEYCFKKAHLDREGLDFKPKLFVFTKGKEKVTLTPDDGEKFQLAKVQYLDKLHKSVELNKQLPDLDLGANSRIAIKEGMKLSNIFSPITFNLLLKYRQMAIQDPALAIVLSTCLHLCRLTDIRSQSQFPFWVPKFSAVDRNIFDLLKKKTDQLVKILDSQKITSSKSNVPKRVNTFKELIEGIDSCYLLFHTPIQKLNVEQVPDSSVDLVFTDPPYFDQVAYSEYLVIWEFFTGMVSDLENEIIQSNREKYARDRTSYLKLMSEGFAVISQKLKENHFALIYFKDSKLSNISDFLQLMEDVNLHYIRQIHLAKPKFTYKQNTSQESTVEGDSLYVFKKLTNFQKRPLKNISKTNLDQTIVTLVDAYLEVHGPATASKILDDFIIPRLWDSKILHMLTTENTYQELINANYLVDKESRKLIDRK